MRIGWTPLSFNKFKGKTLPQVLFKDPDWFFYLYNKGIFLHSKDLIKYDAAEIYNKSKKVRIPIAGFHMEYVFMPRTGKLDDVRLVPKDRPYSSGGSRTYRDDKIDFSVPSQFNSYDKLGGRIFIKRIKGILFGNESVVMTRNRCEEFFNKDNNFLDVPEYSKPKEELEKDLFGNIIY